MKEVVHLGAQGDVLFRRIERLPNEVIQEPPRRPLVVAHSETGHHHVILDDGVRLFERRVTDSLLSYLAIDGEFADVVHQRSFDRHETLRLGRGIWEIRRQREWSRDGHRAVID